MTHLGPLLILWHEARSHRDPIEQIAQFSLASPDVAWPFLVDNSRFVRLELFPSSA